MSSTSPLEVDDPEVIDVTDPDRPWIVLVWNDPINLMSYVTFVFQKLFGYSLEKATALMLDVHEKGRAVVSNGTREKAELDVFRLHEHGLWATMQQEDAPVVAFGFGGGPVRRERDGSFTVHLSEPEQLLLKSLLAQLRTLLKLEGGGEITEDSGVRRLFPTAYPGRDDLEAEYQGMVHDDLLGQRLAAIDQVEETIVLPSVDEEQLGTWLRTFNDLRLVLGTRLDVSEDDTGPIDPDDPDAAAQAAYEYLGWLLESTVIALTAALPRPRATDRHRYRNRRQGWGPGPRLPGSRRPSVLVSPPSVAKSGVHPSLIRSGA